MNTGRQPSIRLYELVPPVICRVAEERYMKLKRGLIKERLQQDELIDGYGPIFKTEGELLDYEIAELQQPGSATRFQIDAAAEGADRSVDFDMPLVSRAKEEAAST
jgi:hypothetical protein